MSNFILSPRLFLVAALLAVPWVARAVVVTDAEALVAALENRETEIEVDGTIEFERRYGATNNALPVIDYRVVAIRGRPGAALRATGSGFRLLEITGIGRVELSDLTISGFSTGAPGGAVRIEDADLWSDRVVFRDNHSGLNGGAIHVQGPFPMIRAADTHFEANSAGGRGGAISLVGVDGNVHFRRSRMVDNEAPVGCAVAMTRSEGVEFSDSLFQGACEQALVEADVGRQGFRFYRNTWLTGPGHAVSFKLRAGNQPMQTWLKGNVLVQAGGPDSALCQLDGNGELEAPPLRSFGDNVAMDESCGLTEASDSLVSSLADVLVGPEIPVPADGGPALDVETLPTTSGDPNESRCAIADANGLGRPQDGDGDGIPACDSGAVEAQGGPDIGPWQSGAYFDPERNGEGYFVEMLDDGRAWVTFFTYTPIGGSPPIRESFPEWFHGVGQVAGNSIVVSTLSSTKRGRFGEAFDPDDLRTSANAGLSLVFPDCASDAGTPGTAYYRSGETGLADVPIHFNLFTRLVRLSSFVNCDGQAAGPESGRSGSFFAPARAGEGLQVQWLPDGRVLAVWYTFDLNGRQLWMISQNSQVDGDTVTLSMVYPAVATAFGPAFDPEDIEFAAWGTLTLKYTGCDTIELGYDSVVEGFGSGSFTYQRLTQPAGTACEL